MVEEEEWVGLSALHWNIEKTYDCAELLCIQNDMKQSKLRQLSIYFLRDSCLSRTRQQTTVPYSERDNKQLYRIVNETTNKNKNKNVSIPQGDLGTMAGEIKFHCRCTSTFTLCSPRVDHSVISTTSDPIQFETTVLNN